MNNPNPNLIKYFSSIIEKETGIQYNDVNSHHLNSRLQDLAKFLNYSDLDLFWNEVQKDGLNPTAKSILLDIATNNETSFFRDGEIFEFFKKFITEKTNTGSEPLRIWCTASSTGQEPCTLAIILAELKEKGINRPCEIIATDLSERVLKQAISGTYSQLEVQRGLPATLLLKYFEQITIESSYLPSYKIKPEIASKINYKRLNLLEPWPHQESFDIIFCRNVLIYQSVENKKQIISRFKNVLKPNGFLILGAAESLLGLSSEYTLEQHGKACVYKLKTE